MIYFILKKTISEELLSYLNNYQIFSNSLKAKEFNCFKTNSNLGIRLKNKNGWYGVVVCIKACGALGPGSIPGTGPWSGLNE